MISFFYLVNDTKMHGRSFDSTSVGRVFEAVKHQIYKCFYLFGD